MSEVVLSMDSSKAKYEWFPKIGCEKLTMSDYETIAAKKPRRQVVINDLDYIKSFQVAINQLPTEGEIMKDMAESARYSALEFQCGKVKTVVEFYDSLIKTPATSFYARSTKLEEAIWTEIESLLSNKMEMGMQTPFYKDRILDFGDFSLTYIGSEDRTPKGTTASSFAQEFKLSSKKYNLDTTLTVTSGQLPPRPLNFEVNKKSYVLNTYAFKNETIRPRHLVVSEK